MKWKINNDDMMNQILLQKIGFFMLPFPSFDVHSGPMPITKHLIG